MLMLALVVTAPVLRLTDPVAWPTWLNAVVAVTGMSPNCLNEAVAGGSVKVADSLPVLRFTDDFSVPGPSATLALTLLITVFPVTGYLTVRVEDPSTAPVLMATIAAAASPVRAVTDARRNKGA